MSELNPKKYKATTLPPETPDPFVGYRTHEVQGYYVKYVYATPYPISTHQEHDDFVEAHTKHYIMFDGFSDWGLPRKLEKREIDVDTLEEIEGN
jgi:hypothetical protein